jgi:hypothetical protein
MCAGVNHANTGGFGPSPAGGEINPTTRYIHAMLRHLIRLLQLPLALLVLFYDWGWEKLGHVFDWLAKRPLWRALEHAIGRLPPWGALLLFALPTVLLFPIKLAALWLIAQGQHVVGVLLIVAAKLLGTAVLARLFRLTQPALLQLRWFARAYYWFVPWKDLWFDAIRASWPWRVGRVIKRRVRRAIVAAYNTIFRGN